MSQGLGGSLYNKEEEVKEAKSLLKQVMKNSQARTEQRDKARRMLKTIAKSQTKCQEAFTYSNGT